MPARDVLSADHTPLLPELASEPSDQTSRILRVVRLNAKTIAGSEANEVMVYTDPSPKTQTTVYGGISSPVLRFVSVFQSASANRYMRARVSIAHEIGRAHV